MASKPEHPHPSQTQGLRGRCRGQHPSFLREPRAPASCQRRDPFPLWGCSAKRPERPASEPLPWPPRARSPTYILQLFNGRETRPLPVLPRSDPEEDSAAKPLPQSRPGPPRPPGPAPHGPLRPLAAPPRPPDPAPRGPAPPAWPRPSSPWPQSTGSGPGRMDAGLGPPPGHRRAAHGGWSLRHGLGEGFGVRSFSSSPDALPGPPL